ncbi:aldo/keto reductase [Rhodoferax saidenbachensis]|uniref:NADP-dependent oxidoreductase domain-containing protein n=1 Tax=Rhodoferax saidenbachensis TaxID=1484693 RepID=A0A1P8KDS8_9BURK|nr:aldo/keto reductase [Rhodoferax saidenbachensis]APW44183.1 hypothetical protein RS694_17720 [Rhodoferax saidenbachensis]
MTGGAQRLGLGTVQWGMPYGITNRSGMATPETVVKLLARARQTGVGLLDTAWTYGDAERVLGEQGALANGFSIVTKTRPLKGLDLSPAESAKLVEEAFHDSLARLRGWAAYGLLVHHADDLLGPSGDALWVLMQKLRSQGLVEKIGCSLYDPQQFFLLEQRYALELVQLPYNIYDQRYVTSGMAARTRSSGVEVHVRSAFLQGILLSEPARLPPHFAGVREHHAALWAQHEASGLSPLQAALGFCLACPDIDKVIVGCEQPEQWEGILEAAQATVSPESLRSLGRFAIHDEAVINPSRWK